MWKRFETLKFSLNHIFRRGNKNELGLSLLVWIWSLCCSLCILLMQDFTLITYDFDRREVKETRQISNTEESVAQPDAQTWMSQSKSPSHIHHSLMVNEPEGGKANGSVSHGSCICLSAVDADIKITQNYKIALGRPFYYRWTFLNAIYLKSLYTDGNSIEVSVKQQSSCQ